MSEFRVAPQALLAHNLFSSAIFLLSRRGCFQEGLFFNNRQLRLAELASRARRCSTSAASSRAVCQVLHVSSAETYSSPRPCPCHRVLSFCQCPPLKSTCSFGEGLSHLKAHRVLYTGVARIFAIRTSSLMHSRRLRCLVLLTEPHHDQDYIEDLQKLVVVGGAHRGVKLPTFGQNCTVTPPKQGKTGEVSAALVLAAQRLRKQRLVALATQVEEHSH